MSTSGIQGHLQELHDVALSLAQITHATEAISEEVRLWQGRPLKSLYPLVCFDEVRIRMHSDNKDLYKKAYLGIGTDLEGTKEVLGMWIAESDHVSFWNKVVMELKDHGVNDILIVCSDGLNCFLEALSVTDYNS
jgi:transposase-like protein